jgi:hypothetical protein
VELIGANALLAGRYEEDRLQPQVKGDMAILEDGPHAHGKGLTAVIAFEDTEPSALAVQPPNAFYAPTVRAGGASRPNAGFHECKGSGFVVEMKGGNNRGSHDNLRTVEKVCLMVLGT